MDTGMYRIKSGYNDMRYMYIIMHMSSWLCSIEILSHKSHNV